MTFTDQYFLCQPGTSLFNRIWAVAFRVALGVQAELSSVVNHGTRLLLANQIAQEIFEPGGPITGLARAITSDGITDATATDAELQARCEAVFDEVAGLRIPQGTAVVLSTDGTVATTVVTATPGTTPGGIDP